MKRLPTLFVAALLSMPAVWAPLPLHARPSTVRRVLVVHWYDRSFPANAAFEQQLQSALQAAEPQHTEYYAEYLDTNKFPDDNQSELLAGYLRQKYRSVPIDVIVTRASPSLEFLIKHRKDLFPDTPIVFATERTVDAKTMAAHNATGL